VEAEAHVEVRPTAGQTPARSRAGIWLGVGAVLAVAGVLCLIFAVHSLERDAGTPHDVASGGPVTARGPDRPPVASPEVTSPPVRLSIPAIDVSARVTRLGLNRDRTVEVPSDPLTVGWFRLGPPPGDRGSAVILGHVDSLQGPAVFYRLRYLAPGDRVTVRSADGSIARFRVTAVRTYPNDAFPARQVYGPHGRDRGLQLVTCGGAYDRATGYQSNVVVYTTLSGRA
jgi:hypothetical protein